MCSLDDTSYIALEDLPSEQKNSDGEDLTSRNAPYEGGVVNDSHDNDYFEHRNVDDILHRCACLCLERYATDVSVRSPKKASL